MRGSGACVESLRLGEHHKEACHTLSQDLISVPDIKCTREA
jgi:hypothetical protein